MARPNQRYAQKMQQMVATNMVVTNVLQTSRPGAGRVDRRRDRNQRGQKIFVWGISKWGDGAVFN